MSRTYPDTVTVSVLDVQTDSKANETETIPALVGKRLAIYLPDLSGGGAEKLYFNLTPHFIKAGLNVVFLVDRNAGALSSELPAGASLDVLGAARTLTAIPRLTSYLRRTPPDILLSALSVNSVAALWARRLAGLGGGCKTKVVVSEHNAVSEQTTINMNFRLIPFFYRHFLDWADAVIGVSRGVVVDLAKCANRPVDRIGIIYNGVVNEGFSERAAEPCPHPWYKEPGNKIFVSVGRLVEQKGFANFLNAFAKLQNPSARLIILGDGVLREPLLAQAAALGIAGRVDLPGFIKNPLPYVSQAHAYVMSSRYEGFSMALAEALACGIQVVSTDCNYGPAEILEDGSYGMLVPVDDADALAAAMQSTIDTVYSKDRLRKRGMMFTTKHCASEYLTLFTQVLGHGPTPAV